MQVRPSWHLRPQETPHGAARVARWYCPDSQVTFSLLPDCLASGLPGSLAELEAAVVLAETSPVLIEAARQAHPDPEVGEKAARRWLKRRQDAVHACLWIVRDILSDRFRDCRPTVLGMRDHLGHAEVLPILCALLAFRHLYVPAPIGVCLSERKVPDEREISFWRCQHSMGPDPPAISGRRIAPLRDRCRQATGELPEN